MIKTKITTLITHLHLNGCCEHEPNRPLSRPDNEEAPAVILLEELLLLFRLSGAIRTFPLLVLLFRTILDESWILEEYCLSSRTLPVSVLTANGLLPIEDLVPVTKLPTIEPQTRKFNKNINNNV